MCKDGQNPSTPHLVSSSCHCGEGRGLDIRTSFVRASGVACCGLSQCFRDQVSIRPHPCLCSCTSTPHPCCFHEEQQHFSGQQHSQPGKQASTGYCETTDFDPRYRRLCDSGGAGALPCESIITADRTTCEKEASSG